MPLYILQYIISSSDSSGSQVLKSGQKLGVRCRELRGGGGVAVSYDGTYAHGAEHLTGGNRS